MFSAIIMAATGILSAAIPAVYALIFKSKVKTAPLSALFVGAGVFIIFALLLEQLLHAVMLPFVSNSDIAYIIYGALAAGIFEETGRFLTFKTVLKKQDSPKAAVMYGIGHGGCESVMILGMTMVSGVVITVMVNSIGIDELIKLVAAGNPELEQAARAQIETFASFGIVNMAVSLFERAMMIVLQIALSVLVFESARVKGRAWLYPVCILVHAACDIPAAMYQRGILGLAAVYILMAILTAAVAVLAVRSYKRVNQARGEA